MSHTITIRLDNKLAAWLEDAAAQTGLSKGQLVRDQLERARRTSPARPFMRWSGVVRGPRSLSLRKGYSRE
ncbi:MAG: ribbon-helix-helix protein, CopG family [Verrucomicrobia bacterium]|nr:ribbon-helix-helix protein, CopG family [Verrucomicrobiota bacterium]